jgi:Uma2 family endonuclease
MATTVTQMNTAISDLIDDGVYYPDSDSLPMADSETNLLLMHLLAGALRHRYSGEDTYVASDLFWYPVKGKPKTVVAPDVMVAFGRPGGRRRSYRQWREGDVAPQLVIEVISPKITHAEMINKRVCYERHGVEEYIELDPAQHRIEVWRRVGTRLVLQHDERRSRLIDVSFEPEGDEIAAFWADGSRLLSYEEYATLALAELARANEAVARADEAEARAAADSERVERFAARLRELGIDPDEM